MTPTKVPIVKQVFESGADDHVYDSLVLIGPLVIAAILIAGRTVLTTGLALLYVGVFGGYLVYKGIG